MSRPLVIGLSHLYGESRDLEATTQFWKTHDLDYQEFRLPVTEEKSKLFLAMPAAEITMRLFKTSGPGIEFLEHRPIRHADRPSSPLVSLFCASSVARSLEDPEHNRVIYDPRLKTSTTICIRVHSVEAASLFFEKLSFERGEFAPDEAILMGINLAAPCFKVEAKLFPQMSCRFVLVEDRQVESDPRIDHFGLSGLSFVVPSIKEVQKILPLKGLQIIEDSLSEKQVAFTNDFGMMIECLEIVRRKPISIDKNSNCSEN